MASYMHMAQQVCKERLFAYVAVTGTQQRVLVKFGSAATKFPVYRYRLPVLPWAACSSDPPRRQTEAGSRGWRAPVGHICTGRRLCAMRPAPAC